MESQKKPVIGERVNRKSATVLYCICGMLGDCNGTLPQCVNCWEVEKRLEDYLKHPRGIEYVKKCLLQAEKEERNRKLISAIETAITKVSESHEVAYVMGMQSIRDLVAKEIGL